MRNQNEQVIEAADPFGTSPSFDLQNDEQTPQPPFVSVDWAPAGAAGPALLSVSAMQNSTTPVHWGFKGVRARQTAAHR
jgi:hypothetical protein